MLEAELNAFREQTQTRNKLMTAWLRGEGDLDELMEWDMDNPCPREPEGPEQPPLVWIYRPPDLPHDNYSPYSLLYDRVFSVGGRKWRQTGRSVDNSSTRFGRLDYPECKRRVEDWFHRLHMISHVWRNETYNIRQEEGVKALHTVPHEIVKGGYDDCYTYAVFWYPDGHFGILSGYGDVLPAFGTPGHSTHHHAYVNRLMEEYIQAGMSKEEARAHVKAKESAEAPARLLKMLVEFKVAKADAVALVARMVP